MNVRLLGICFLLGVAFLFASCTPQKNVELVRAALDGDLPAVQRLLQQGANIEGAAFDGLTPLDAAARQGHLDVVRYLIEAGAAVNGSSQNERTALGTAIVYEHTDCARYLISHGGQIRGTAAWKQGLLSSLKRDNKMELYQITEQEIEREGSPAS